MTATMEKSNTFWKVDLRLLPLKFNYFLFFAGLACGLPFRTVFAKQLGISATAVGVIFLAAPFIKIVTNPLFGFLLDYFKKFRLTASVIMVILALSHIALVFIPPKETALKQKRVFENYLKVIYKCSHSQLLESEKNLTFNINSQLSYYLNNQRFSCNFKCDAKSATTRSYEHTRKQLRVCEESSNFEFNMHIRNTIGDGGMSLEEFAFAISEVNNSMSSDAYQKTQIFFNQPNCIEDQTRNITSEFSLLNEKFPLAVVKFNDQNTSTFTADFLIANETKFLSGEIVSVSGSGYDFLLNDVCLLDCFTTKCFSNIKNSIFQEGIDQDWNEFLSVQFWAAFTFMSLASVALTAAIFLTDTICYEILGPQKEKYGQQRLWGTIGWGLGALAGGYLNEVISGQSVETVYSPGFYLLAGITLLDLIPVYHFKVDNVVFSSHICKDVCFLLSKPHILLNIIVVYIVGVLSGLIWNYQFWFMEEIGASQVLLGLSQTFECLFAELPCFIASGWIIKKLGHTHCNSITFLCFGLRYLSFAYMYNPWMTLLAALLHGPTFGLFYASMTMYGKTHAPPGTEATVQALLSMSFEGVGAATGSILGGVGFDKFGSRSTFLYASIASFVLFLIHVFFHILLGRGIKKKPVSKE